MPDLGTGIANEALTGIFTPGVTYMLSLHSTDPSSTGANELSGGGYARQAITFTSPVGGVMTSVASQRFSNVPAAAIIYLGLWSAAGAYMIGNPQESFIGISAGANLVFSAGTVQIGAS
jgi:hypothetical protein